MCKNAYLEFIHLFQWLLKGDSDYDYGFNLCNIYYFMRWQLLCVDFSFHEVVCQCIGLSHCLDCHK